MAKIEIVAEIANAHQGDPKTALALARAALDCGADAVKFQVYSADELLVRSHPRYEHFRRQSFDRSAWVDIFGALPKARVYADLFGFDALAIARYAGIAGYKIHSSDLSNTPLLRAAASCGKPMLLAVGGSTVREIEAALSACEGLAAPVTLLHGFQSYPTALEDTGLERLAWLQSLFGSRARIGYADHIVGDDAFAYALPLMAIGAGARVIEKHITFDRAARGVDWYSSLEPVEFAKLVADIRRAESAIGDDPQRFAASERNYRQAVKKHWVAARALPAGHAIGEGDLVMKRVSGIAAEPVELDKLLGRKLLRPFAAEEPVDRGAVPNRVFGCIVARMRSNRLPGKALLDIAGMPALAHLLRRVAQMQSLTGFILCTTVDPDDDAIADLGRREGVEVYRGPVLDVLGRMLGAVEGRAADVMLRITGDDILVDPVYADAAVAHHLAHNLEYTDLKKLPSGTEIEVFDAALLGDLWRRAHDRDGTEYLTTYIVENRDQFRTGSCPVAPEHARGWRLTLDTPEDLSVISALLEAMRAKGRALDYRLDDIAQFFAANPDVLARNNMVRQRSMPVEVTASLDWGRVPALQ